LQIDSCIHGWLLFLLLLFRYWMRLDWTMLCFQNASRGKLSWRIRSHAQTGEKLFHYVPNRISRASSSVLSIQRFYIYLKGDTCWLDSKNSIVLHWDILDYSDLYACVAFHFSFKSYSRDQKAVKRRAKNFCPTVN